MVDFERILNQFGMIFRDFQGSVTPKLLEIIVSGAVRFFFNVFGTFQKERKFHEKTTPKSIILGPKPAPWQPLGPNFSIFGRFWNGSKIHHFLVSAWITQNQHKWINGAPAWPSHAAVGRSNYDVFQYFLGFGAVGLFTERPSLQLLRPIWEPKWSIPRFGRVPENRKNQFLT